jgi:AAA+ ATPase superfamily predicted ATPase
MQVGQPVHPRDLVDRESEVKKMISDMKSSINYNIAVLGYRRIGKTSILMKVRYELDKSDRIAVAYFDVKKNMSEPRTFLTRLQKAIFDAYLARLELKERIGLKASRAGRVPSAIFDALRSKKIKGVGVEMGPDGSIIPSLEFDDKEKEYSALFYSIFETAKVFAEKSGIKFVVMLDEFQDFDQLDRYPGLKNIFALFRSVVQERGKKVSYIISGSRVHLLRSILESGESPLFSHFKEYVIGEMDRDDAIKLFSKYLKARRVKSDNRLAEEAYELVGGHPFYLMSLAEGWDEGEKLSGTFHRLLTSPLGSLKLYCDYVLAEDLGIVRGGPALRSILRVLSKAETGYSYSDMAQKVSMPMTSLPVYLNGLARADLIVKGSDGGFTVRDRVLRRYLQLEVDDIS